MRVKYWLLEGVIAGLLALFVTYIVLEPAPSIFRYAALLGWSGIVGVFLVLIQGFRRIEKRTPYHGGADGLVHYEFAFDRWGGIHTALAIAVTMLIAVHGLVFFPGLLEVSFPIWLGATAFTVMVALNVSGVVTEVKRKSREFRSLKRLHVVLMLIVVVLSVIHIELFVEVSYFRSIFEGAIVAFVVAIVVLVSVPLTIRAKVDH
jgi:glucan phosphoethanolaminetransferase (alkaline phosphatase superfamily)